jgi:hypothetical protein
MQSRGRLQSKKFEDEGEEDASQRKTDTAPTSPSSQPPEKKLKGKAQDEIAFQEHEFLEKLKDTPAEELKDMMERLRRNIKILVSRKKENQPTDPDTTKPPVDAEVDPRDIDGLRRYKQKAFDIGMALSKTDVTMSLMQFLNASPHARTQMGKMMSSELNKRKGVRKQPKATKNKPVVTLLDSLPANFEMGHVANISAAGSVTRRWKDVALTREETGHNNQLGYIDGYLAEHMTTRILIDSGANLDCISRDYVMKLCLRRHTLDTPWPVSLADDSVNYITEFVVPLVVVGDILCVCFVVCLGQGGSQL